MGCGWRWPPMTRCCVRRSRRTAVACSSTPGDGVCALVSPKSAVDAAVAAQRVLELPWRMGLATREAELRDGDYLLGGLGGVTSARSRGDRSILTQGILPHPSGCREGRRVHPAAHPPRLSTAADRPPPELTACGRKAVPSCTTSERWEHPYPVVPPPIVNCTTHRPRPACAAFPGDWPTGRDLRGTA
jgi:hypothetical protein